MTLVACHECQKKVSSEAKNCPNCGAPIKAPKSETGGIGWGMGCLGVLAAAMLIGQIFGSSNESAGTTDAPRTELNTTSVPVDAKEIPVWSDTKARYWELERGGSDNRPTILTMRNGPSGTSYASREYNCSAHTFRYLAEGDSRNDMYVKTPPEAFAVLVEGSISDVVGHYICNNQRTPR